MMCTFIYVSSLFSSSVIDEEFMGHIQTIRAEMKKGLSVGNMFDVANGIVKESSSSLSLTDYRNAVCVMCEKHHKTCKKCGYLSDLCCVVLKKKLVSLKELWTEVKRTIAMQQERNRF